MSELSIFANGLPAHLRNAELDETTKALMGGSGGSYKRISIKGSVFRMVVNGKEDRKSTRLNSSHVSESRMPSSA